AIRCASSLKNCTRMTSSPANRPKTESGCVSFTGAIGAGACDGHDATFAPNGVIPVGGFENNGPNQNNVGHGGRGAVSRASGPSSAARLRRARHQRKAGSGRYGSPL